MSGKTILKNTSLSIGCLVIGGIVGYSINHLYDNGATSVKKELLSLEQFQNVGDISIKDVSKVATLRTESGENLYALYKENLLGNISDVRYVLGDGYLVYNSNVMHYVEKPNFKELSSNTESIPEKDKKGKVETVKSYVDNVSESEQENRTEKQEVNSSNSNENNDEDDVEKSENEEQVSLSEDLEYQSDMSNIDLSELIIEDYDENSNESTNSEVSEGFSTIDSQSSNSQPELKSGEIRKTEQKRENRVVEELDFVDNNFSGSTRDKILSKSLPDEEKREQFEEELSSAAEENYKREAIKKISDRLSDFTIDFESQTDEEKKIITVFTDPTCPFCRRLHGDIEKLQLMGYTVRYLFIPRDGMNSPVVPEITYASCFSKDKSRELANRLFNGRNLDTSDKPESCNENVIERQLKLATSLGAKSTPFIIDNTGGVTEGYSGIDNMLEKLEESN